MQYLQDCVCLGEAGVHDCDGGAVEDPLVGRVCILMEESNVQGTVFSGPLRA